MRLKKIKPGVVIHCKNYEEKKALLEEAERLGLGTTLYALVSID